MLKKEARKYLDKIGDDEHVFILRARDRFAAGVVRTWCVIARKNGTPPSKVEEAFKVADAMESHPNRKIPD